MPNMAESVFWKPSMTEWRAYCELHPEADPKQTLLLRDGTYRFIQKEEAPLEDVKKGMELIATKRKRQKDELARSDEEALQDAIKRDKKLASLKHRKEYTAKYSETHTSSTNRNMKAVATDDPFVASVANAVDKSRRSQNGNFIIHARRLSELPKIALSDPEAIRERVDWYFQLCVTDGVRPNLPGLALAFGMTRTGLMNALADRRMTRECADELGRGIAMLDEIVSQMTLEGYVQPVAAIYLMNNWLGYKNASEVTTRSEVIENGVDQKALEQKYQTVIDVED